SINKPSITIYWSLKLTQGQPHIAAKPIQRNLRDLQRCRRFWNPLRIKNLWEKTKQNTQTKLALCV
ncbi:MAG: hypothetical protein L0L24_06675, partial [Enterobacterales bacterium]|nr:hypothetical protein [Enterobacterales bacterium]